MSIEPTACPRHGESLSDVGHRLITGVKTEETILADSKKQREVLDQAASNTEEAASVQVKMPFAA